ncbi:hypothetical protein MCAG_02242 [Micromonospora sp. ATCC 39149]|uniref:hypothetical protein n=1 Tax=Micromonospora sp. (strain ATCC 39149 / NRRL 15099 / SCC 1413) TaxID=219305 RepID=UPI0001A5129A|nr:hypothetical protein [Micromonospora sp. ATCC 39149]EEP71915.1 hypothetical protein MCAG_02242 [Micromonospora sp. ATCC 39149]
MAQRNSSGRGGTATRTKRQTGNQNPNTPTISESEISRMRVDDIRGQLRRRGVAGISALRKPELVKTLARTLRAEGRGAARRGTGPAGRASGTKATAASRASGGTRKAAPSPAKATSARAKAAPSPAKATSARAKAAPSPARAKAAPTRRATGVRARQAATSPAGQAGPAQRAGAPAQARQGAIQRSAIRTGRSSSRSARSSQPITSLQDRPERPGRSLVTTNHDVIRRWARERNARPATIAGTEREGRAGVLTFNLPGYRESSRVREITWDEWFRTFDGRGLNLIYQEQLRDGRQSNFFRTESPDREDA